MKKIHNMAVIRKELVARGLNDKFDANTKWTEVLKILKSDEQDNKYITPLTKYAGFKWNSTHFEYIRMTLLVDI